MEKYFLIYLGILCAASCVESQDTNPTLDVNGQPVEIHGVTETVPFEGKEYTIHKYMGIPFAQPPIGELRFRKPEPVRYMESPFNATKPGMPCVQFNFDHKFPQSEDCLHLNIYRPGMPSDSMSGHAVAIWIHGGGFTEGFGSQYDGTFLSFFGNVIVVIINYRLGPYGFLSTEDDNAPGNYAFWDQHMAFQWVHDNIGHFGGDKERVTIFGESAGAISVSHQGLITQNKDLFQRIIAQSGSAFLPFSANFDLNALEDAQELGSIFGCDVTQTEYLMECLRSMSNEEIKNAMVDNGILPTNFGYIIDNVLIKRDITNIPYIIDKQRVEEVEFYRSLDVINGFNSHEGMYIADVLIADRDGLLMSREQMKATLGPILEVVLGYTLEQGVMEMMMGEYTNWTSPDSREEVRLQIVKLFGDITFGGPAIEIALTHAKSPSSAGNYVYHFVANPPFGPLDTPEWIPGANHADELTFVFGMEQYMPDKDPNQTWEIQLSRKMATYWTNFMKSGNPNNPEQVSPMWPEYDMESQSYLKLEENTTEKSVGHFLYAKENNFWFNVFQHINMDIKKMSPGGGDCVSSAGMGQTSMLSPLIISILSLFMIL